LPDFPVYVRDRIESCLSVLYDRNRMVMHPRGSTNYDDDEFCWLKWALERHNTDPNYPFSSVFSTEEFIVFSELNDKVLVPISTALDADCWVNRKRTFPLIKTASHLNQLLAPFVRFAKKVTLIDPYMTCREDRFLDTVQACANLLGKHDGAQSSGIIHIHAGDPTEFGAIDKREPVVDRLNRWESDLKMFANQWGHTFFIFLWGRKRGGKLPHDRFIITDQGGIEAPGGLDFLPDSEAQRANHSRWSWLDPEEVRRILQVEYHHSKSPYEYLGSRKIEP
ncbi:MAG: hypothetical protein ABIK07_15035, partial [Planctomycetota bacterium]